MKNTVQVTKTMEFVSMEKRYTPHILLNHVKKLVLEDPYLLSNFDKHGKRRLHLPDTHLAKLLGISPPIVCKAYHCKYRIGDDFLLKIHDLTGLSFKTMRRMIGDTP